MADAIVGLADAIKALRKELMAAITEGQGEPVQFKLAPIELSLQVVVTKGAEGKIGWHVLGLGGSYNSASTQTLKLRLEPVTVKDDGTIGDEFTVSDQVEKSPRIGPRVETSR
ncbi:MAG TPA: trypco2 family protein [Streptosporangiaceae bacterium]